MRPVRSRLIMLLIGIFSLGLQNTAFALDYFPESALPVAQVQTTYSLYEPLILACFGLSLVAIALLKHKD